MNGAEYVDLVTELEGLARDYGGDIDQSTGSPDPLRSHHLWNAPFLAVGALLYSDALGERVLPQEVVDRLWEIAWLLDADPEEVMPQHVLAKARPERRTRPPMPVRYPLKGGGHGSGRGIPGKTEYPARWSDDDAMDHVLDVARLPDGAVAQPDGTFRAWGVRDGVELRVVVTPDGDLVTAYPVAGDGVVTNPIDDVRAPYVERLQRLVEATDLGDEVRAGIDELMAVGEWDQVVLQLQAVPTPDAAELAALAAAAGLTTPG